MECAHRNVSCVCVPARKSPLSVAAEQRSSESWKWLSSPSSLSQTFASEGNSSSSIAVLYSCESCCARKPSSEPASAYKAWDELRTMPSLRAQGNAPHCIERNPAKSAQRCTQRRSSVILLLQGRCVACPRTSPVTSQRHPAHETIQSTAAC